MSNEKQETSARIIAEMRQGTKLPGCWRSCDLNKILMYHADRIEALLTKSPENDNSGSAIYTATAGNNAALREALSDACYAMFNFLKEQNGGYEEMAEALDKAKAALAAPPRNCDVGTADEQIDRFNEFCDAFWMDSGDANCGNCPLWDSGRIGHDCPIRWAQMPYEAEQKGENDE